MKRLEVEVEIESIAAGGEGVGRMDDGRVVFVHRTAPGERVGLRLVRERPKWARGSLVQVLRASSDRRPAPCPHYADCGGCTLEHLEYDAQLRAKAGIVRDALARIGGIEIDVPVVEPSPREHRYRNRVSFALRRLGGGRVVAGFHALHDPGRIVPIDARCLLPEEPISEAWEQLRRAWGPNATALPSGERLRLTLRATVAGRISLLIEGGYGGEETGRLLDRVERLDSIWHRPDSGRARLVAGAPGLPETWGAEALEISGAAFLQVNRYAAERLERYVVEAAGDVRGRRVIDAYCGIGLHARRLARAGADVVGIELDPEAIRAAQALGLENARFLHGRVEDLLLESLPADLLILNPPRAGLDPMVTERIVERPPTRIVYISCDPATLARDLQRLSPRMRLRRVRCFDLFPQTAHVETVAELEAVEPSSSTINSNHV